MKIMSVLGVAGVDSRMVSVPDLVLGEAAYEQHIGYKSWKVPRLGRATNWLQWNDGDARLRICFPNQDDAQRTWKLFARFGAPPMSGLWDRPQRYERAKAQWMPAGADVWGCSYEDLNRNVDCLSDVARRLLLDLELSYRYALSHYGN